MKLIVSDCEQIWQAVAILDKNLKILIFIFFNFKLFYTLLSTLIFHSVVASKNTKFNNFV